MDERRTTPPQRSQASPVLTEAPEVPNETLVGATAAWLGGTFLVSYLLLPALYAILGVGGLGIFAFWQQFPAFLLVSAGVAAGVSIARPRVRLTDAKLDPVAAGTLGGLGMWALTQNILFPFALMSTFSMVAFIALNVVENLMIGSMLASFTKRAETAFTLAAGFQFATFVVSILILAMTV